MKKVKIRKWEDMAEEFGCDSLDNIDIPRESFTINMENMMPVNRIIDIVPVDNGDAVMYEWTTSTDGDTWLITDDMVEYEVNTDALVSDFIEYVSKNPEQRFWQAIRNWSEHAFVYVSEELVADNEELKDTFYMEGK